MNYKKLPIEGYKVLNMYPVYVEDSSNDRKRPFKIVGIRENQVELEGLYSSESKWFDDDKCFVITTVCEEQLKPKGCQVHNLFCCGGGSVIDTHVDYWENLIN